MTDIDYKKMTENQSKDKWYTFISFNLLRAFCTGCFVWAVSGAFFDSLLMSLVVILLWPVAYLFVVLPLAVLFGNIKHDFRNAFTVMLALPMVTIGDPILWVLSRFGVFATSEPLNVFSLNILLMVGLGKNSADLDTKFLASKGAVSPSAMFSLAYSIDNSAETLEKKQLAYRLFCRAAKVGNPKAMEMLGHKYLQGDGVEADAGIALDWYRRASASGSLQANNNIGVLYAEGTGVGQNWDQAAVFFSKAAERGNAQAMINLANCYENGQGVEINEEKAESLREQAKSIRANLRRVKN